MRILRTTERYEAGWREQNFIPHDEADWLISCRSYDIKLQKQAVLGQNVPNLSHLPENVHKRFCAHPAEKQDALFCCSVNFHHWRYGFESLSPVLTDKTAAISEGKFRRGRHILPRRLLFVKKMFIMHNYTESNLDKLMNFHWKLKKYQLWYRLRCRIKVRKWIFTWIKAIV